MDFYSDEFGRAWTIVQSWDGTKWMVYEQLTRRTRRQAINAFEEWIDMPGEYDRQRRKGYVRAVKVDMYAGIRALTEGE